ncbi:MAG TPA: hypothetical protein VK752_10655 [Bryobacteraceae bacterium]|nr:hypothetical protein [Bryobacteraceae bacterium]
MVLTEQRVQVTPHRFRIPDICVLHADAPIIERLDDYLAMGVANVWVIDPRLRRGYRYTSDGFLEAKDGVLRTGTPDLSVPLTLFDN